LSEFELSTHIRLPRGKLEETKDVADKEYAIKVAPAKHKEAIGRGRGSSSRANTAELENKWRLVIDTKADADVTVNIPKSRYLAGNSFFYLFCLLSFLYTL
jgi:hypothetical protein